MRKRWFGYAAWLLASACLYFFENNTGTRTVLICSILFPLIPTLRAAFFTEDGISREETPRRKTARTSVPRASEEPGDIRLYQPGDPVRRIHWKLSAKRDELLIRETGKEQEHAEAETAVLSEQPEGQAGLRGRLSRMTVPGMALCAMLLLILPEARLGVQKICNRVFAASEAANAYAYEYFPVPEGQSAALAAVLITAILSALAMLTVLHRSRLPALCIMTAAALFQVYFGLPLPAWANILLYGLCALRMIRRPVEGRNLLAFAGAVLLVSLLVIALRSGTDTDIEAASENVRDQLSRMAQQITGTVPELPEGETETRHVHTLSLQTGGQEARTDRAYRLATVEEEQVSMPHFIHWIRIILLFLLAVALVVLPFAPFLLLSLRKKKAEEARKAFSCGNAGEAVCAIFRQVILWHQACGRDPGNLLFRNWAEGLPETMPEGYPERCAACAKDYEEAAYSDHEIPEEKRERALDLLKETESALWQTASRKQRFRIRYWMCLHE